MSFFNVIIHTLDMEEDLVLLNVPSSVGREDKKVSLSELSFVESLSITNAIFSLLKLN